MAPEVSDGPGSTQDGLGGVPAWSKARGGLDQGRVDITSLTGTRQVRCLAAWRAFLRACCLS